jgi:glycosyltransferase involved in cell wall biosynthesis
MRIVIDAGPTAESVKSGVAFYTLNLIKHVLKLDDVNEYLLYGLNPASNHEFQEFENAKIRNIPDFFLSKALWYYWTYLTASFVRNIAKDKPDIYFSTYPVLPWFCPSPKIITVYDLTPIVLTDAYRFRFRFTFSLQMKNALRRADKIVAISQSTRNDLINILKSDPKKIFVIYPGCDKAVFRPDIKDSTIQEVLKKYGIHGKYILYSGTLEPKKNIGRLIESFSMLKSEKNIRHKLVLAGKKSWKSTAILESIDKLSNKDEVILTGYIPETDLASLMSGADVFVFPSLHEGFGIPLLEAMACGTPVITSKTSSLPEVVGEAGILVNPYSALEISEAILRVITNDRVREQMRQKGLDQAKRFSWEESARNFIALAEKSARKR